MFDISILTAYLQSKCSCPTVVQQEDAAPQNEAPEDPKLIPTADVEEEEEPSSENWRQRHAHKGWKGSTGHCYHHS